MASFIYNGRSKAALTMTTNLIADLKDIVSGSRSRTASLRAIAGAIRRSGSYRWVGLYDVDHGESLVCNVVFSGTDAPAHLTFPVTKGLTGVAVAEKRTVNVANVAADPHYLTAFGNTRSEIIVPIFDHARQKVVGTIDVESELVNAFDHEAQAVLEQCADLVAPLWH